MNFASALVTAHWQPRVMPSSSASVPKLSGVSESRTIGLRPDYAGSSQGRIDDTLDIDHIALAVLLQIRSCTRD